MKKKYLDSDQRLSKMKGSNASTEENFHIFPAPTSSTLIAEPLSVWNSAIT